MFLSTAFIVEMGGMVRFGNVRSLGFVVQVLSHFIGIGEPVISFYMFRLYYLTIVMVTVLGTFRR